MKRIIITLLFLFLAVNVSGAHTNLPDEVTVREHWRSLKKNYSIETSTQKLGSLYRHFFSFPLTYDFYDPMEVKTATAKASFFAFGAHLDIYDQTKAFLGSVEEKVVTFFPTFEILASDSSTKLARGEMNFWSTKIYIYDPATNQEMVIMSRPLFRSKNDWTIHVTNRALLEQKNIDSRVLMTVLAVQGEINDWYEEARRENYNLNAPIAYSKQSQPNQYDELSQQIMTLSIKEGLDKLEKPSQESLETLADELDQQFNAENYAIDDHNQNDEERIKAFTSYCFNLVGSQNLSYTKKKAILTLLSLRLQAHN